MTPRYLSLTPASDRMQDYLDADDLIDCAHPAIEALAAELQHRFGDPQAREDLGYAGAAFAFVRDEIDHSADTHHYSLAYRASDVLAGRNAICFGKAHLLAALLRARGIPAGLCYQRLADGSMPQSFALHGLVAHLLTRLD